MLGAYSYNGEHFSNNEDIKSVYSNSPALPDQVQLNNCNLNILQIGKISTEEMLNAIKSLNSNAAMGVYNIPAYYFPQG